MKQNNIREKYMILAIIGIAINCVAGIILFATFLMAWFNNNSVTICIDNYNEKYLEVVLIPFIILWGIWSTIYFVRKYNTLLNICFKRKPVDK